MKEFTNYLKKKKYILLFLGVLFVFGVVVGAIIGLSNMSVLESQAFYYKEHISEISYQYILLHFFFLALSLFTSYFGIGLPIILTLFFYEGMSFGFLFALFTSTFHTGGFLFAILFLLITKGVYLVLFVLFFFHTLEIGRKRIGDFIYKTNSCSSLQNHAKAGILLIFFCFLFDIALSLFGTPLISLFQFLLK